MYRVMAFDWRNNFISAQYVEKKTTEFQQIIYLHSYWLDQGWDCYLSFFAILWQSNGIRITFVQTFVFRSISWEQMIELYQILYMHWSGQDLGYDCYTSELCTFLQSYGLDWRQNFVSPQYLENKSTEFYQFIYMCSVQSRNWYHSRMVLCEVRIITWLPKLEYLLC